METIKLFDSELKIMDILWEHGSLPAKEISIIAEEKIGWNKNTTYTVIKKLIDKGAVSRHEPKFICMPKLSREQVQLHETKTLVNRLFGGSKAAFFSQFMKNEKLTKDEIDELKALIEKAEGK